MAGAAANRYFLELSIVSGCPSAGSEGKDSRNDRIKVEEDL
jgi:hypothetical protein